MIYTVWKSFHRFLVVCNQYATRIGTYGVLKKGWKCRKCLKQATACLVTGVSLVTTELSSYVSRQWVLCRDRIWSGQGVPGSRPCFLSVVTMSRPRRSR